MTPAISSAAFLVATPGSGPRVAPHSETFQEILNDVVPPTGAVDAAPEPSPKCVPAVNVHSADASFTGLAMPTPDAANPVLASEDKSEAKSDKPIDGSSVLMTQIAQVAPHLSVPQVIAAVAKAIAPQTEVTTQTDDNTPQSTANTVAALTSGRNEQRQWLSKVTQKAASDVPVSSKSQTPPAPFVADTPILDAAPDIATATVNSAVSAFQPIHAPAAAAPDLRQLYLTPDNQWIDTLRNEIVSNSARDNQLQFTLKPELLGKLDIMLTTQDGKVDIRFDASTLAAAQILATEQVQLIEDLRQAGVKVGQFEMTNSQDGARRQQRQQQEAQPSDPQPTPNRNTLSNEKRGRFA